MPIYKGTKGQDVSVTDSQVADFLKNNPGDQGRIGSAFEDDGNKGGMGSGASPVNPALAALVQGAPTGSAPPTSSGGIVDTPQTETPAPASSDNTTISLPDITNPAQGLVNNGLGNLRQGLGMRLPAPFPSALAGLRKIY